MFGTNAPASTWHMTFDHANLGPVTYFAPVPSDSPLFRLGNGQSVQQPSSGGNGHGHGHGNGRRSRSQREPDPVPFPVIPVLTCWRSGGASPGWLA